MERRATSATEATKQDEPATANGRDLIRPPEILVPVAHADR